MVKYNPSRYIYAAYEKGDEGLCVANADSAAELGRILGISRQSVIDRVAGRSDQSRSKYIIERIEA